MCAQCDNEDFTFSALDSVNVDGENYSVFTQDVKDSLPMILAGFTFGDTYAATVVIHTGDKVISTSEEYFTALDSGEINPDVNKSFTAPYKGDSSSGAAQDGHKAFILGLQSGLMPAWMTMDEQREAVMYSTDSPLDVLFGYDE